MKSIFTKSQLGLFAEEINGKTLYTIQVDNKGSSTNTITIEFVTQFTSALDHIEAQKEPSKVLLLKSLKPETFIVGANIQMLKSFSENPECTHLFD
jgi:enoyl-CoA hydratase/carnithine racemase